MDRIVYSALAPRDRLPPGPPPGPLVGRALDHAAREHWRAARAVLDRAAEDPAERRRAQYLLWEVCQVLGEPGPAIGALRAALRQDPVTSRFSPTPRRRILALATPGDFQANLPLGALLEAPDIEIHTLWLTDPAMVLRDPAAAFAGALPAFDCIFIAIAEDPRHRQALAAADRLATALGAPVLNSGQRIAALSRAGVAERLRDLPDAIIPAQTLLDRAVLEAGPALGWPVVIRPEGSHAGHGLARLDSPAALVGYLGRSDAVRFQLAPFIDYRSGDGYWRKYRIILVDGQPWPYHMAVHDDWTIWYYNSRMDLAAWKRQEEARFLGDFSAAFPAPARRALGAIAGRIGLDYCGIDCGLMPDGRLVLFEVETGMLVHGWDRPGLYPYKRHAVRSITTAVERMIDRRIAAWSTAARRAGQMPGGGSTAPGL